MLFVLSSNTPTCHHISTNTLVSFSLFQATGKGIYASNTESYPKCTINLCPADRHDKAEKSVKLFVIICHLQVTPIRVLKVLIEHRLSVFLPLLPRILSLSLNLSLRHRMYNCIHHRVVSPHLSLQHEKLPRPLNLSSPHLYLKHDQLLLILLLFRKHIAHQHQLGVKNLVVIA